MSDDLDRMEEIARGATEDGLADGILAYETNLDRFYSTFDPPAVLQLISRLRKAEAALRKIDELPNRLFGGGGEALQHAIAIARQALQPLKEPT